MFGTPARPDSTAQSHDAHQHGWHPGRITPAREQHPATVIVLGSTTTALLIEALAIAGMFPAFGPGVPTSAGSVPTICRAGSWASAAAIAGSLPGCVVIAPEAIAGEAPRLVDRRGRTVEVRAAETVLSRSRDIPPHTNQRRTVGERIRLGVEAALAPADSFRHILLSMVAWRAQGAGTRSSS